MLSDKVLGEVAAGGTFESDRAPDLARETLRLRKEARALRKFLEARDLWGTYRQEAAEARASPAGKPAGKKAGKPAGAAV